MGEYVPKEDVFVNVCPLPVHVKGLIREVRGDRFILINEALSDEAKAKALRHELRHLRRDDLRRVAPIEQIEREAEQ